MDESSDYGSCANCQLPFQKKSSKVERIIIPVKVKDNCDSQEEDIISIYEALSVIFEIPPLTPNLSDEGSECVEGGGGRTKKEIFEDGSRFKLGDGNGYGICVNCSEILKTLYKCFQNFMSVCKLDSEIGKILKGLEEKGRDKDKGQPQANQVDDINGRSKRIEIDNNNCSQDDNVDTRIIIKTEPQEISDQESDEEDVNEDVNGNGAHSNDQAGDELDREIVLKHSPAALPDSDDDDGGISGACSPDAGLSENDDIEEQNMPPPPPLDKHREPDSRRNLRERRNIRRIIESDDDFDEDEAPEKVTINVSGGRGVITQLKCPSCPLQFLHVNTLLCHRRIIHRDNIKFTPPTPLPQIQLTKQGNLQRLQALADANGKTSSCPICRLEVPRTDIRYHLSTHTRSRSKPWLCTICGRNFDNQTLLNAHAKSHISGISCKKCHQKIPPLQMLNHIRNCAGSSSSRPSSNFSCKICHKLFSSNEHLMQHRSKVHGHFWKCKLCGIRFTQRNKMQMHMNTHKQKKSHKCKICDKAFDRMDVLRLHIKRFHRNNEGPPSVQRSIAMETGSDNDYNDDFPASSPIPSPSPPIRSTPRSNLQDKHKAKRPLIKKKELTPPPPNTDAPLPLNTQVDLTTPVQENRFVCKGCAQQFPKASDLDSHLLDVHTDETSFLCKICNRKLQDSYCLKLHVKTHGEMKPLECFYPNCSKIYRDKNTFFYHLKEKHEMDTKSIILKYPDVFRQKNKDYSTRYIRKRIGQAPAKPKKGKFPCEVCGRIFTQIYGLRSHVKLVHDKVKDYLCKYCGKAFARKSYFQLHEKLHISNEAPYKCHLCNKGFRLPGNLRMHLQSTIHNPNRDFVCDICGKGFNRNDNLRLHVKTVHLKIPIRKPKSEASDRYAHGGRHRIYIGGENPGEDADVEGHDNKTNATSSSTSFGTTEPLPGTSHSFLGLNQDLQQHHQPFLSVVSAFQRHPGIQASQMDTSSMDSSSHMSGEDSKHSSVDLEHHHRQQQEQNQNQQQFSSPSISMPVLHHSQDGRTRTSGDSGQQHQFSHPSDFALRGFQYR